MMPLKQLKQLTWSATRRNVDVVLRSRFCSSPAACQALTTPKTPKRLSRDDRRAVIESFIAGYRAANGGKFPSLKATYKEVGGGYYVVRDIFQEIKLRPKESLPVVAKALSEVSASVPNDASSQTLNDAEADPQSHSSLCNAYHSSPVVADPVFQADNPDIMETGSDHKQATIDSSHPISYKSNLQGNNLDITATRDIPVTIESGSDQKQATTDSSHPIFEGSNLQGNNLDINATRDSPVTIETGSAQKQATTYSSHPISDESNLQGNNLDITATHDETATETAPSNGVDCKSVSNTHLPEVQTSMVSEECLKIPETEEEEKLTLLGSQESKADHPEGAAVSANDLPSENRQVSEEEAGEVKTGEKSGAWSNIMSFAKGFVDFWRK